jgi:hypothetical protein
MASFFILRFPLHSPMRARAGPLGGGLDSANYRRAHEVPRGQRDGG